MKTLFLAASILALASPAAAWAPPAHQLIGAIADRLLTPNASQRVHDLLGVDLKTAATWGDCARFVQRQPNGAHVYAPPEGADQTGCAAFTTPAGLARMTDYAARNWDNCVFVPGRPCSASYHVTDVAFLHDEYDRAYFGANFRDSVAATSAAIRVLQGFSAPAPFSIKDQAEALFMITHFAGDLHEPLAVASVYLDPQGRVVDPDSKQISNPLATSTHASSLIRDGGETLKAEWEAIPADLASLAPEALLAYARGVPPASGPLDAWPKAWASETVTVSHKAFAGLTFGPQVDGYWSVITPPQYADSRAAVQRVEVTRAGAHLAQLLNRLWP